MFNYKTIKFELFKYAKIPNWMPEDIKNHPDILESPDTVEKDLLDLKPFREDVTINIKPSQDDINYFAFNMLQELRKIKTNELAKILMNNKLNELLASNSFTDNIKTKDGQLNKGQKITKIYSDLARKYDLKPLEKLNGFKEFSFSFDNLSSTVVFSTDPTDILTMSSRSNWTSCQDIFGDNILRGKAVGSALMKNIGIIYLTNKRNFKERGEEMLFRALVRNIKLDDEHIIFVDKIYPNDNKNIRELFVETLSRKTNYLVTSNIEEGIVEIDSDNYQSKLTTTLYDNEKLMQSDIETSDHYNKFTVINNFIQNNKEKILENQHYAKWVLFEINDLPTNYLKKFKSIIEEIYNKFKDNQEINTIYTNISTIL